MVGWLLGNNAEALICLYAPSTQTNAEFAVDIYSPASRRQKQRCYGEDGDPHNPRNLRNTALKAGLEHVPRADEGAFAFNVTPC